VPAGLILFSSGIICYQLRGSVRERDGGTEAYYFSVFMRNLHGSQHRLHAGKEVGGDHDLDGGMECLAVVWSCGSSKLEVWVWHSSLSLVGNRRGQYLFENLDELMRRSHRSDLADIIWGKYRMKKLR